jgi:hypothetical protein
LSKSNFSHAFAEEVKKILAFLALGLGEAGASFILSDVEIISRFGFGIFDSLGSSPARPLLLAL